MRTTSRLLLLLLPYGYAYASPFPVYSEQFTVKTHEYDAGGNLVLNQTLAWDLTARRTQMVAEGSLVGGGVLEQIMRCDTVPDPGFFVQAVASSATLSDPSSWSCTNTTVDSDPSSCQLGSFWENPAVSVFVGNETIDGVECGKWEYRGQSSLYAFWGTAEAPCATAELDGAANSSSYVWMLTFSDFVAGAPAFPDAFEVTDGVECPSPSTPSSSSSTTTTTTKMTTTLEEQPVLTVVRRHSLLTVDRRREGLVAAAARASHDLSLGDIRQRRAAGSKDGDAGASAQHKLFLGSNKSLTLSWVTASDDGNSSNASWGTDPSDLSHEAAAATTESYAAGSYQSGFIHAAVLGPLEWLTTYYYSTSDAPDTVLSFTSPPPPSAAGADSVVLPFSFAVIGDLGQTGDSEKTRDHVLQLGAGMVVHAGDISYAG